MTYEEFVDEIQRRAGPIAREEASLVAGAYLETLRERLSGERPGSLAAHLPKELATHLEGDGEGEEFVVWEFHERFAQKTSIAPEMATRYARHVGDVLGDAVPEEELEAMREELPPSTGSCRSACSPIPIVTGPSSAVRTLPRPPHRSQMRTKLGI